MSASTMKPPPIIGNQSRKFAEEPKDFMNTFKPLYYFLRALGLMPFSIERTANGSIWRPKVKVLDILWLLSVIFIHTSTTIIYFKCPNNKLSSKSHNTYKGFIARNLHLAVGLTSCVLFILMDLYNRYDLVDLLKKFSIFDKEVTDFTILQSHAFMTLENVVVYILGISLGNRFKF